MAIGQYRPLLVFRFRHSLAALPAFMYNFRASKKPSFFTFLSLTEEREDANNNQVKYICLFKLGLPDPTLHLLISYLEACPKDDGSNNYRQGMVPC